MVTEITRIALISLLIAIFTAVGCNPIDPFQMAGGTTHQYRVKDLKFDFESSLSVAVAVNDRRSYIIDGTKPPSYVGSVRQGFGVPFEAFTETGNMFAVDIGRSIMEALKASGARVKLVQLSRPMAKTETRNELQKAKVDRYVLLTLRDWRSDTYWSTKVLYDMHLEIMSANGSGLEQREIRGTEAGRSDALSPKERSREIVPAKFRRIMELLFNDPKIAAALR